MFKFKNLFAFAALLAFALTAAACASPTATSGAQPSAASKPGSIVINGAGATFPQALYSRWFFEYANVNPAVRINYNGVGSGGGIAQITAKTVDFGASDAPMADADYAKAPGAQMFPIVAGPIVPVYNVKGDDGKVITDAIKFPYTALADIYLGKIKTWNDKVLAGANPSLKLPAKPIQLVVRSDSSGTTNVFTDYLSAVSPDWKSAVGVSKAPKWPSPTIAGNGNPGVTAIVQNTDASLGYVELSYAKSGNLPYGAVQNKAGEFAVATAAGVQAAMADYGNDLGSKMAISIVNAPSKAAYPISTYTFLIIYMDQTDCTKGKAFVDLVKWALSSGDKFATDLDFVPLPDSVKTQVNTLLGKVTCQGKPF